MSSAWTCSIDRDWVAWLTFDLPGEKVNKITAGVMAELESHLETLAADESIKAVVITSGKADFIVGADIGELARIAGVDDARAKAEAGHRIFGRLAALPVPTVAVIHGNCLGGGLELALACDYRLTTDDPRTSLGLPEVGLGIVPGWGGTQRLPRLIGLPAALPMILTGRPVNGRKAWRMGLADGLVTRAFREAQTRRFVEDVLQAAGPAAVRRRRRRAQRRLPRLLAATGVGRRLIFRAAHKQVLAKTNGNYPAPMQAIELVRRTYGRDLAAGLAREAEVFSKLACTPVSRNLVWLFETSQRVKKAAGRDGRRAPHAIGSAAVVGAGIMGSGIAFSCSHAGIPVRLKDIDWDAVSRGMAAAAENCRQLVKRKKLSQGQMTLLMHRIRPAVDYQGFGAADIVVEAVAENLALKQRVLREIEDHVGEDTVICTNTSSLAMGELASALRRPKNFVGLHFFNPVPRMPLVEVVPGRKTTQKTVLAAVELVRRVGKTPIVVGDCAGFLVNRILLPYLVESAWMVEEGVEVERLDGLLERFGMPMGPMTLVDEVGLDVGYEVARVLESAYGERMHVPQGLGAVAEAGHLRGRKSGRGFYVYDNGHKKPNPEAAALVAGARQRDGVEPAPLNDRTVVDRAILIMVNEAARCLDEGVVDSPEQLDIAMVMGTGFAPFRGGLLRYADERGVPEIRDRLAELAGRYGPRFEPAPLLQRVARNGGRFYRVGD